MEARLVAMSGPLGPFAAIIEKVVEKSLPQPNCSVTLTLYWPTGALYVLTDDTRTLSATRLHS